MRISVFGMGYVGVVTAACLAHDGHRVTGVDVAPSKVEMINEGRTPIAEEAIADLVQEGVQSGRLLATMDAQEAVSASDMAIVCVGTPSVPDNGALDTQFVATVASQVGESLRTRRDPFLFVLRSTVLPGTTRSLVIPTLERCVGRPAGEGYDVVFHPEFLREGSSVRDFYDPPKIVVGERSTGAGGALLALYADYKAPQFVTSLEVAETVKYADNAFHAVKITFANEIGQLCKASDVDSRKVMDIFSADRKLNISPKYLKPGFAFGGSCLPKDLRALLHAARTNHLALPMLEGVLTSNKQLIERVAYMVLRQDPRTVGLVGLSFKPGTDDLRESPLVLLAEYLIGKGLEVKAYDGEVVLSQLLGRNRVFLEQRLPHISRILVGGLEDLSASEVIVIGHPVAAGQVEAWIEQGKLLIDLVGIVSGDMATNYVGVAW